MTLTRAEAAMLGRRRKPRLERDIQREILDYLAQLPGVYAWKAGAGMFRMGSRMVRIGKAGVADVIGWKTCECDGLRHATWIAVEVKRPGQHPTLEQRVFLDRVRAAGGLAIVAHSVADVRAVMEA